MRRIISLSVFSVFTVLTSSAADIAFLGGASGDLSLPANWTGGALPGAGDIGVIDAGGGANASYTLSSAVTFGGLRLTNLALTNVVSGARLTLGASGISVATRTPAAEVMNFANDFGITVAQTWLLGDASWVRIGGSIDGTADLLMESASGKNVLIFDSAPGYGGKITCKSFTSPRFYRAGTIADDLAFDTIGSRAEFFFTNRVDFATLFPGRAVTWNASTLWKHREYAADGYSDPGQYVTLDFAEGDSIVMGSGRNLVFDAGSMIMAGGSVTSPQAVNVGYANKPALWSMSGGTLSAGSLNGAGRSNNAGNHRFELSGGSVSLDHQLNVSYEGGDMAGAGRVTVGGGTLTVGSDDNITDGIILQARGTGYGTTVAPAAAHVAITGGVVTASQVSFGYPGQLGTYYECTSNAWAEFVMSGGLLKLGRCGFRMGSGWNVGPVTNAVGRVRFTGGTLEAQASANLAMPVELPPSAEPFTFDTGANGVTFAAPLAGVGTLRKKGAGTLALADAATFHGTLDVREGKVRILGTPAGAEVPSDGCCRWTADAAAADLASGASVLSWTDVNNGVIASRSSNGATVEKKVFNGHDGLYFGAGRHLDIAAANNPIVGQTNFTVVVVFRLDGQPSSSGDNWYQMSQMLGCESPGVVEDWGLCFNKQYRMCAGYGIQGSRDFSPLSSADRPVDVGRTHVAIVTWRNGDEIIHLDGYETTNTTSQAKAHPRKSDPFYIGSLNTVLKDSIAELRIYPDRILSLEERQTIGAGLLRKYAGVDVTSAYERGVETAAIDDRRNAAALSDGAKAVWTADTLSATTEDGAVVTTWPAAVGDYAATLDGTGWTGLGATGPVFVKGKMNGHDTLRFSVAAKTALGVAAQASPFVGLKNFTLAIVLRTTTTTSPDATAFYLMEGIIGTELGGTYRGDFGVGLVKGGTPLVGSGQRNEYDVRLGYDALQRLVRPFAVNDGLPHCIVFSCDVESETCRYRTMVDGVREERSFTSSYELKAIENARVVFGSAGSTFPGLSYNGELAEIRLYDSALGFDAMDRISRACAEKYGFVPLAVASGDYGSIGRSGLCATNISVAAGATLQLPRSATAPFTLRPETDFTCLGAIEGSLRYGAGTTLDLTGDRPTSVDDLQLASGSALIADYDAPLSVTSFKADGAVTVSVANLPTPVPRRIPLFGFTGTADVSAATLVTENEALKDYVFRVNPRRNVVELYERRGAVLIVR